MDVLLAVSGRGASCCDVSSSINGRLEAAGRNTITWSPTRGGLPREIDRTEVQLNPTVVHFIELCARYLTHRVYPIIEIAWGFWPREGLSRQRCNQIRCLAYAIL